MAILLDWLIEKPFFLATNGLNKTSHQLMAAQEGHWLYQCQCASSNVTSGFSAVQSGFGQNNACQPTTPAAVTCNGVLNSCPSDSIQSTSLWRADGSPHQVWMKMNHEATRLLKSTLGRVGKATAVPRGVKIIAKLAI